MGNNRNDEDPADLRKMSAETFRQEAAALGHELAKQGRKLAKHRSGPQLPNWWRERHHHSNFQCGQRDQVKAFSFPKTARKDKVD